MAQALLKVTDINKSFAGVHALKNVSLEIMPGEIHCLAGENGCGKSTLIKIISGVYERDAGTVEFDGRSLGKITPIDAIMNGIQVIYQDFSVFPNLTVMENLALNTELAAKRRIVSRRRMRQIAEEAVAKIDFQVDLDALVGTLSVAEKQMVAISRALMFNAKLIIMDEPTTALTKKEVQALFRIILKLKEQGIAILFVSHKLDEVFEISERFTIFRSGELVVTGNTKELDDQKFTFYMTGREFNHDTFQADQVTDQPILELQSLSLEGHFADISFQLRGGEILGITGLLDSGRTELALSMFGLKPATSGRILRGGQEVSIRSVQEAISQRIGFIPEDRLSEGLFLEQSIADNIAVSEIDHMRGAAGVFDRRKYQAEVDQWVKELAIKTPDAANAVSTLSGGNQQRVVLAKWLACHPEVLILNGPTVGVDIGSKHDIHAILQRLARENGMGIIIISDDLPEVLQNCSRVLVLKDGRITLEAPTEGLQEAEILAHMM
ncbi:MAG: sugar ABC transporter ATP-binding protein [Oscillospiraceae bacterium]|nr:sugar ABC transporter ATP-binding protein [Oscillospiraceae bacterium]